MLIEFFSTTANNKQTNNLTMAYYGDEEVEADYGYIFKVSGPLVVAEGMVRLSIRSSIYVSIRLKGVTACLC